MYVISIHQRRPAGDNRDIPWRPWQYSATHLRASRDKKLTN